MEFDQYIANPVRHPKLWTCFQNFWSMLDFRVKRICQNLVSTISLGGNRILKYICKRNFQYISCFWFSWVEMNCWTESKWACQGYSGFEKSCQNSHCFDMMMTLLSKLLHWMSGQSQQHWLGLSNGEISRHNFVLYNKSQNFHDDINWYRARFFWKIKMLTIMSSSEPSKSFFETSCVLWHNRKTIRIQRAK
jgi:hypothetical protein